MYSDGWRVEKSMQGQRKTIDIRVVLDQLQIRMEQFDPKYAAPMLEAVLTPQEIEHEDTWNYAGAFFKHELSRRDARYLHTN